MTLPAHAFSSVAVVDGSLRLSDSMGIMALLAANIEAMFFNASRGPGMWVMLDEMFPNQMRGS